MGRSEEVSHRALVCWLMEERAPAGICQKDYASKKMPLSNSSTKAGREGGMRTGTAVQLTLGRGSAAVCDVRQ